jgi:hypothetical protein
VPTGGRNYTVGNAKIGENLGDSLESIRAYLARDMPQNLPVKGRENTSSKDQWAYNFLMAIIVKCEAI